MSDNVYTEAYIENGDPIFGEKNEVTIYDSSKYRNQKLVYYKHIHYLLFDSSDPRCKSMRFKIGAYLYYHAPKKFDFGDFTTFFIGDYSECELISQDFTNQEKKLVSFDMIEEWFPKSIDERLGYLVNYFLDYQNHLGQINELKFEEIFYYLFINEKDLSATESKEEREFLLNYYKDNNYLNILKNDEFSIKFVITEKSVKEYQVIPNKNNSNKDAFIAIKFKDNGERISAIHDAIVEAGYNPVIMSEVETNNWIMPEIFYQIKKCKFLVADFSIRCDGAYYEAGYALALGKEVIHLFDKNEEENNGLHFDVAQKSTVMYSNYDELKDMLVKRIKATIQD